LAIALFARTVLSKSSLRLPPPLLPRVSEKRRFLLDLLRPLVCVAAPMTSVPTPCGRDPALVLTPSTPAIGALRPFFFPPVTPWQRRAAWRSSVSPPPCPPRCPPSTCTFLSDRKEILFRLVRSLPRRKSPRTTRSFPTHVFFFNATGLGTSLFFITQVTAPSPARCGLTNRLFR